jgi:hypothetical protein
MKCNANKDVFNESIECDWSETHELLNKSYFSFSHQWISDKEWFIAFDNVIKVNVISINVLIKTYKYFDFDH